MRQNQQNKNRMRGRSRKGPNPLTRTFESNGPDVKIRGTALHVAEKYTQLARDASSSGDRVMAENYLQHAEHYYRVIATAQAALQPSSTPRDDASDDNDDDLEPIGSDRFEPRQIDMRMPGANGQYPQQERDGNGQQGRGDYDRNNNDRRDQRSSEGNADRQGHDRQNQDRQGQDRQGQDRQPHDRQDRGDRRDRNERRPRYERGNFDQRREREPRPAYEPRPVVAGGSHPMPLDAPQPDVAFPEPAPMPQPPAGESARAVPPAVAATAPPPRIEQAATEAQDSGGDAGPEKPVRRRRTPRARKPDAAGENTTPEPSTVD